MQLSNKYLHSELYIDRLCRNVVIYMVYRHLHISCGGCRRRRRRRRALAASLHQLLYIPTLSTYTNIKVAAGMIQILNPFTNTAALRAHVVQDIEWPLSTHC